MSPETFAALRRDLELLLAVLPWPDLPSLQRGTDASREVTRWRKDPGPERTTDVAGGWVLSPEHSYSS